MPEKAIAPCPLVGIVLVNYNGGLFLPDCLQSLFAGDYPNTLLVLVDNASSDGSLEWVSAHCPGVILLRQPVNGGFATASNIGLRECLARGCEYCLLLNNDTVASPDFLSRLMDYAAPDRLLVPKIYFHDAPEIINNHLGTFDLWRGVHRDWFFGRPDSPASRKAQEVPMANGCALLIPKKIIERVGMLDEIYFMYAEDIDFILRAVQGGGHVWFVPEAVIHHRESSSSGGMNSPLIVYYTTRNRLYFMVKHQKNRLALGFFLMYFFLTRLSVAGQYLARGQRAQLIALKDGIADFCRGRMGRSSRLFAR